MGKSINPGCSLTLCLRSSGRAVDWDIRVLKTPAALPVDLPRAGGIHCRSAEKCRPGCKSVTGVNGDDFAVRDVSIYITNRLTWIISWIYCIFGMLHGRSKLCPCERTFGYAPPELQLSGLGHEHYRISWKGPFCKHDINP